MKQLDTHPINSSYNQEPRRPESLLVKRWAESGQLTDEMWGMQENIRQRQGIEYKSLQLVNGIYRKVKKCIEYHQEKRKQRVTEPGKPFEIGQLVHRKLQHSERRKLGKMAPYKSPRYRVIDRKGCTYWCQQLQTANPRIYQRHYNELEAATKAALS